MESLHAIIEPLLSFVQKQPEISLVILLGSQFFLFLLLIILLVKQAGFTRKQKRLLRGADGQSIERMLLEHTDSMNDLKNEISRANSRGDANATDLRQTLQRVGLVRFDAFPDIGGKQSFSLALLDAEDSGLVLSGLCSRQEMRVYAKPMVRGASSQPLTAEERQAINEAQAGGPNMADEELVGARRNGASRRG